MEKILLKDLIQAGIYSILSNEKQINRIVNAIG
jgi:hypothetical protein